MSISIDDFNSVGFKRAGAMANGGSTIFHKEGTLFTLVYHGDNFYLKKNNDPKLNEIELKNIPVKPEKGQLPEVKTLYKGECKDISRLREILEENNIL